MSGIEWGSGSYESGKYYKEELPHEIEKGEYTAYSADYDWEKSLTYRYGISFAKLFAVMNGVDSSKTWGYVPTLTGGEVFKLNLYPIAFDSTHPSLWREYGLDRLTGFEEKHLFRTWCFYNRFPIFSDLVRHHRPRIIIGTGVSYLEEFFACFGGSKETASKVKFEDIDPQSESAKSRSRRFYWVPINETSLLFVIPFFSGVHGLNSDYLLQKVGDRIREISEY